MQPLTVVILTAGYGSRMGPFGSMINKSLVPYKHKPLISHIIEKFDSTKTQFIIACGQKSQQVKDYVNLVHKDKNIIFVDVKNFDQDTTGPATSILACEQHLSQGFLWVCCDTIFNFDYQNYLDHNWIAVYPVDPSLSQDYCYVTSQNGLLEFVKNKEPCEHTVNAFIGLMYCKDRQFLNNLMNVNAKEHYEGFNNLDLHVHEVDSWLDFGTYEKWQSISQTFDKPEEIFYIDNHKFVKFNDDQEHIKRLLHRSKLNPNCMPPNICASNQFLSYDYVSGGTVYDYLTPDIMSDLLDWFKKSVWIEKFDSGSKQYSKNFYYHKTLLRLAKFKKSQNNYIEATVINDQSVLSIDQYLNKFDWDYLYKDIKWGFVHGDAHWDNIIYNPDDCSFCAIDWRADFGGSDHGDIYYDIAKILEGIDCNLQYLRSKEIFLQKNHDVVQMHIPVVGNHLIYRNMLQNWSQQHNFDWLKIEMLVAIIYLNASALHTHPYNEFFFNLSKLKFSQMEKMI